MNAPGCPPQDRPETTGSGVAASVFQADNHSCTGLASWSSDSSPQNTVVPNNSVALMRTFDERPLGPCSPDGTHFSFPMEPGSLLLRRYYQASFERPIIDPSLPPSPPVPTTETQTQIHQLISQYPFHQQLTHLQLLLELSREREKQLQLQLMQWDQWLQQFRQLQQQRQSEYLQHQQQLHQVVASQDVPPFQQPVPMNNGPQISMQPWVSEPPYPVPSQILLCPLTHEERQNTNVPSTLDIVPSSSPVRPPSTIQSERNPRQSYPAHGSPASHDSVISAVVQDRSEAGCRDRVEIGARDNAKGPLRRFTEEEKAVIREYHKNHPDESYSMIGKIFGCSKTTAYRVINPSPEAAIDKAPKQKQQEQLTQLQLQLAQQREQLKLQLLLQDHQIEQIEQQQRLLAYHHQQHTHARQDTLPFQQPAPLDNGLWVSIQPWWSMFSQSIETQSPLYPQTHQQQTSELAPGLHHGNPPSAIHSGCNQGQSCLAHWLPISQDFHTTTVDRNRDEAGHQDRVEIRSGNDAKGTLRRFTEGEKAKIREYRKNHPNKPYSEIARLFGCSKSTAHRIVNPNSTEVVADTSQ
ncbi:MAG: hypothetical protein J3Q66DRAFT_427719 [Benniella sp.]|nr:MAG: hypothetical protein J3Q66DRAFT_427719 [Benniella sp.]